MEGDQDGRSDWRWIGLELDEDIAGSLEARQAEVVADLDAAGVDLKAVGKTTTSCSLTTTDQLSLAVIDHSKMEIAVIKNQRSHREIKQGLQSN